MTTPAEQEAERRYPKTARMRFAFESGAAFEREQLRELLEAAEAYREASAKWAVAEELWERTRTRDNDLAMQSAREESYGAQRRLLAAAAALPGGS